MLPSTIALEVLILSCTSNVAGLHSRGCCTPLHMGHFAPCCGQVLRLQPQGCCLNDLSFKDPWLGRPEPQTAAALCDEYQRQQVSDLSQY